MRRRKDDKYLAWLRTQRCACGCLRGPPCEAAHLRASSARYNKFNAIGRKPDDEWALPLHRSCHRQQHAFGNELNWWLARGVSDPFALAIHYYFRFTEVGEWD